jgi:hypothetical protein
MSVGLTAESSLLGAVTRYAAGDERASLLNANADIASRQAASEYAAGSYNENAIRMRGKAVEGQQVANIGANNLQQTGTPSAVVASTAAINEMDALQTRNNAARRAWGFEVQGMSDKLQASFARAAGTGGAFESILGGGAKMATELNNGGTWF